MTTTEMTVAEPATSVDQSITAVERVLSGNDHKTTGRLFIGFGMAFAAVWLVLGGLAGFGDSILGDAAPRTAATAPLGVLLLGVLPLIVGLGIYLVPLQVGARQVVAPRAAGAALWSWLVSGIVFTVAYAADGGVGGGRTSMVSLAAISTAALLVSLTLAIVVVMSTVITGRLSTMGLDRVPMFAWSLLVSGLVWCITLPAALAPIVVGYAMRADAATWTENVFADGLSFLFRAPTTWLVAVPVLGFVVDAVPVLARRRLDRYSVFQALIGLAGAGAVGVWNTTAGSSQTLLWAAMVLLTGLATLGVLGGCADTLRRGSPRPVAPLGAALLALVLLLGAFLWGLVAVVDSLGDEPPLGLDPSMIAAGQHGLLTAAAITGLLGALAFWGAKIWGGPVREPLGLLGIATGALGGALVGVPPLVNAIATRDGGSGFTDSLDKITGAGWLVLGLGLGASLLGVLAARKAGTGAPVDPWDGHTLEWATDSPPLPGNFAGDPEPLLSERPLLDARSAAGEEDA